MDELQHPSRAHSASPHKAHTPAPRPALITPSVSPPPALSAAALPVRASVPPKRPRLTPSRSAPPSTYDELDRARRDSAQRVLDVWGQLAARYARALDEDDVIDLASTSIIEDRGAVRGLEKGQEFGCFGVREAEGTGEEGTGEEGEGEEGEGDSSHDELDLLNPEARMKDSFDERGRRIRRIPPVQAMDPADAADLEEFLREEGRRRALFGDPDAGKGAERGGSKDGKGEGGEEGGDADADVDGASGGGSSDDEFGGWERDESNAIYEVSDWEHGVDGDGVAPAVHALDEIDYFADVIELPDTPPPSDPPSLSECDDPRHVWKDEPPGRNKNGKAATLTTTRTTSSKPAASSKTADDASKKGRSKSTSRPISPVVFRNIPASRPTSPDAATPTKPKGKKGSVKATSQKELKHRPMDPPNTQLQTPPRSASFSSTATPELPARPRPRPRPITKGKLSQPPVVPEPAVFSPRPIVKAQLSQPLTFLPGSEPAAAPHPRAQGAGSLRADGAASPKKRRKRISHEASNPPEPQPLTDDDQPSSFRPPVLLSAKARGKQKESTEPSRAASSSRRTPSPRGKRHAHAPRDPTLSPEIPLPSPDANRTPRGRKRKRISSGSVPSPTAESPPLHARRQHSSPSPSPSPKYRSARRRPAYDDESGQFLERRRSRAAADSSEDDVPRARSRSQSHHPPAAFPLQDPQAQYMLAHAMHSLSYIMGAMGGAPPLPLPAAQQPWPPPAPQQPWPPYTPTHNRHAYPYMFAPAYSSGTLPPSSPEEPSSPVLRARSKSRGRRVSFKLDDARGRSAAKSAGRRVPAEVVSDSEPEVESDVESPSRGRGFARARTPGPAGAENGDGDGRGRSVPRRRASSP